MTTTVADAMEGAELDRDDVRTAGRWLGPAERPLMGWLTTPVGGAAASGVLVLPPIGYAWWSAHRTVRTIAERLAGAGHAVLRLDYDGLGDSAGDQTDPDRLDAWRASVRAGAEELRALGCAHLTVVGVRLGALLGLLEAEAIGADHVVAWEPVVSGRRFTRELRLMSEPLPEEGGVSSAGTLFEAPTIAALATVAADKLTTSPAPAVTLLGEGTDKLAAHLEGLGADVRRLQPTDGTSALGQHAEYATVPRAVVEAIGEAVGEASGEPLPPVEARSSASFTWRRGAVRETVRTWGERGFVGVLTEPLEPTGRSTVLIVNSGSEPHVGPGRAWVEYARELAMVGHPAVRVDLTGWGESPNEGRAPGRPYDPHVEADILDVVAALRADGHERVVLLGLCAGAWMALRVVLRERVAGVLALNPQLYWMQGDPMLATMGEAEEWRAEAFAREQRLGRYRLWELLDLVGHRSVAGRWLDGVARSGVPTLMLFAEGDMGLRFLRGRLGRRLRAAVRRGSVEVTEVPDIDHAMHRIWLRGNIVDLMRSFLDRRVD